MEVVPTQNKINVDQEDAQKNKHGLWAEEGPVAPWDWRRLKADLLSLS